MECAFHSVNLVAALSLLNTNNITLNLLQNLLWLLVIFEDSSLLLIAESLFYGLL